MIEHQEIFPIIELLLTTLIRMILCNVIYITLCICAGIDAVAFPQPKNEGLPSARLTRQQVQDLKDSQIYSPGHIHRNLTFGKGDSIRTVSIVEADCDILLPDNDRDGMKARSLAPRGQCLNFPSLTGGCVINYCWENSAAFTYSEAVYIDGSNGKSNPSSVAVTNTQNIWFDKSFNTGYNGQFPKGHECSNSNTEIFTDHVWAKDIYGVAWVDDVRCDTCDFGKLNCESGSALQENLQAYTTGASSWSMC
jgi:hypothetical protein